MDSQVRLMEAEIVPPESFVAVENAGHESLERAVQILKHRNILRS